MKRALIIFAIVLLVVAGFGAWKLGYVPEIGKFFASEPDPALQFRDVQYRFSKIFGPADVPLPASTAGTDARVKAVYSPSVIRLGGTYYMFFGVSIYCNGWATARDSIALARSADGEQWQFDRYIIEPDPRSCTVGVLSTGNVYQVNDPSAQVLADGTVAVFYTGVLWHDPSSVSECGVIGLAKFDSSLNLISRNDRYFVPSAAYCGPGKLGFSRPDLQWVDAQTTRLWFDSAFHIKSIPLTSLDALSDSNIRNEGIVGGDLNAPLIDYNTTLLLINGSTITAIQKDTAGSWFSWPFLPAKSEQGWDRDGQGSPELFINPSTCTAKIYMSGTQLNAADPTGYDALNIGMAVPLDNRSFNLPVCDSYQPEDQAPTGFFDAIDCDVGSGWATDPDSESPVVVRFFDGPAQNNWTNLLGEITADSVRGEPVGAHGFVWSVPASLRDGQSHRIYAYAYSNETPTLFLQLPHSGADANPPAAVVCAPLSSPLPSESPQTVEPTASPVTVDISPTPDIIPSSPQPTLVSGDATGDGKVDIFDYNAVISNYGESGSGIPGDADGSGRVDIFDYNLVVSNFGMI